ncbi:MAG: exodeoxyribonuclease VII large subunit [Clostridia bacterium]|nr:exodeoxyribonuclease VII large subunit [Clostridia bacterium]
MRTEQSTTVTVSQLNEYIKMLLDSQPTLHRIYVRGEISNFKEYSSGHMYFTLKDEDSLIRAVMFRGHAARLKFRPENGMKVVICGNVSVYPRDGQYQLYAESIDPDGVGALYLAFEQLKAKLAEEGLFDESYKQPLPAFPSRVGIVTSPSGAAVKDMINVAGRRYPSAELVIYPSAVQGSEAVPQLISGINYFSNTRSVDVVIIGRGGGSLEDLWAFNNEQLARAISACRVPVISAVGHETDFTICDFVADRRAPTPSAAAELAVPDTSELRYKISSLTDRYAAQLMNRISQSRRQLELIAGSRALSDPDTILNERLVRLDRTLDALDRAIEAKSSAKRADLREVAASLSALDPLAILSRGYGAVTDTKGKIVKSVADLDIGQEIYVRLSDGHAVAEIVRKEVYDG